MDCIEQLELVEKSLHQKNANQIYDIRRKLQNLLEICENLEHRNDIINFSKKYFAKTPEELQEFEQIFDDFQLISYEYQRADCIVNVSCHIKLKSGHEFHSVYHGDDEGQGEASLYFIETTQVKNIDKESSSEDDFIEKRESREIWISEELVEDEQLELEKLSKLKMDSAGFKHINCIDLMNLLEGHKNY
jgi:hypothetical protein